jgi:hypothetical protein
LAVLGFELGLTLDRQGHFLLEPLCQSQFWENALVSSVLNSSLCIFYVIAFIGLNILNTENYRERALNINISPH